MGLVFVIVVPVLAVNGVLYFLFDLVADLSFGGIAGPALKPAQNALRIGVSADKHQGR